MEPVNIALPSLAQRAALTMLTIVARSRLNRRREPLPVPGEQTHLTAVLRIGASAVPEIAVAERHYVYPPDTVHITVSNLDAASVDVGVACRRLSELSLSAPTFAIDGLGCSPDTLFLRCLHDRCFDRLRSAVETAFGLESSRSPGSWLLRRLSFANIVRFDGRGEWCRIPPTDVRVRCSTLEIVRTDRYLSSSGTTAICTIPLGNLGATDPRPRC